MNFKLEKEFISKLGLDKNIKKETKNFINLKCEICNEGNSPYKARGFVLKKDDRVTYNCFNCNNAISFYNFIKHFNEPLAKQYFIELKKDSLLNYGKKRNYSLDKKLFKTKEEAQNNLLKIPFKQMIYSYLNENEYKDLKYNLEELSTEAKEYLESRGFTKNDYKDFKFVSSKNDIVIPFFSDRKNNKVYAIQTRGLDKIFHNQMFRNKSPKIYGLEEVLQLPKGSDVFVFESIFNLKSTNLNAVAIIGKTINEEVLEYLKDYNLIFCLDPDKAGQQSLIKLAKLGYSGVFHTKDILETEYDYNDLLKEGVSKNEIESYIRENIFKGNRLYMELKLKGVRE